MSWTPKPGDRVEFTETVVGTWGLNDHQEGCVQTDDGRRVYIDPDALTPVAPPLPPEPAVGSVVRAHGKLWLRLIGNNWHSVGEAMSVTWSHLAAAPDLSPVVVVDDVADWMLSAGCMPHTVNCFRAEFGGWDK